MLGISKWIKVGHPCLRGLFYTASLRYRRKTEGRLDGETSSGEYKYGALLEELLPMTGRGDSGTPEPYGADGYRMYLKFK